jgi:hypothetical protein
MALIGTINTGSSLSFKNRIINGAMEINQRFPNTNFTYTYSGQANRYVTDRFNLRTGDGGHSINIINSTDAPEGFSRSINVVSNVALTNAAAFDVSALDQRIEGLNTIDLAWGTANAKTVAISFWAKSSNTGNFAFTIGNQAVDQVNYGTTYTINTADSWEYKTITVPGPTTGTWHSNTSASIYIFFGIGSNLASETVSSGNINTWTVGQGNPRFVTGCQSLPYKSGAYLALTGVQLEASSSATPFERRPYTTELALCQRYYNKTYNSSVFPGTSTSVGAVGGIATGQLNRPIPYRAFPVEMRTTPSITLYSPGTGASGKIRNDNSATDLDALAYNVGATGTRFYPPSTPSLGDDVFAHVVAVAEI